MEKTHECCLFVHVPPQVMMMVLPLLIIVLLPKVVNTNDPEMRKVKEETS